MKLCYVLMFVRRHHGDQTPQTWKAAWPLWYSEHLGISVGHTFDSFSIGTSVMDVEYCHTPPWFFPIKMYDPMSIKSIDLIDNQLISLISQTHINWYAGPYIYITAYMSTVLIIYIVSSTLQLTLPISLQTAVSNQVLGSWRSAEGFQLTHHEGGVMDLLQSDALLGVVGHVMGMGGCMQKAFLESGWAHGVQWRVPPDRPTSTCLKVPMPIMHCDNRLIAIR